MMWRLQYPLTTLRVHYLKSGDNFQVPRTVHYLWCGSKQFRFQHYLGLLSAIRLLQPLKIVFHYTHLPVVDTQWYNVWFQVSLCLGESFTTCTHLCLSST